MMKRILFLGYFAISCSLLGCDNKANNHDASVVMDADTTSAPVAVEPDTTLQPIIEITIRAVGNTVDDMKFDQDTIEVKRDALIKLFLINEGKEQSMIHNVVFTERGKYKMVALAGASIGAPGSYVPKSKAVIAASPLALPGQTVEMEFSAPADTGSYDFVCTYPGHWQKMKGVLLVK